MSSEIVIRPEIPDPPGLLALLGALHGNAGHLSLLLDPPTGACA